MRAADDTPADLLDAWLPDAAGAHAPPAHGAAPAPPALWHAATTLRLSDTRTLGRLVRWRIPGLARDLTYGELFRAYPFTVLDEGEDAPRRRSLRADLDAARDYPRLAGPEDFAGWDEPGTVRVLFGHWASRPTTARRAGLRGPRRRRPRRRVRLRALWKVIGAVRAAGGRRGVGRRYREISACVTGTPKRSSRPSNAWSSR